MQSSALNLGRTAINITMSPLAEYYIVLIRRGKNKKYRGTGR